MEYELSIEEMERYLLPDEYRAAETGFTQAGLAHYLLSWLSRKFKVRPTKLLGIESNQHNHTSNPQPLIRFLFADSKQTVDLIFTYLSSQIADARGQSISDFAQHPELFRSLNNVANQK